MERLRLSCEQRIGEDSMDGSEGQGVSKADPKAKRMLARANGEVVVNGKRRPDDGGKGAFA